VLLHAIGAVEVITADRHRNRIAVERAKLSGDGFIATSERRARERG
jgi:hypothetical protein